MSQTVVLHGEVDAVVVAAEPVVVILVFDDQGVAINLGCHLFNEVLRTSQFQTRMIVVYQLDIHVVVHLDSLKTMAKATLLGDGFAISEQRLHLAARCHCQANEEKQDCDDVSFHGVTDSICVGYDTPSRS